MKKIVSYRYLGFLAALGLISCSSYSAMQGESDDMYFMASDDAVVTSFAVDNNTPENFSSYDEITDSGEYAQDNFSAKNVNPEYIAKYQVQNDTTSDDIVYFDDTPVQGSNNDGGDINVYNNFYGYNNPRGANAWNTNPWMFNSFYGGPFGFYPSLGFGGFYDPFWGPSFGFRPRLSLSLAFGFGSYWGYRPFYSPFYDPFYSPFYDPFWGSRYAFGGYYGGYYGYGRPLIVNNIYTGESRRIVRSARARRGSTVATDYIRRSATSPTASRTDARRSAVSRLESSRRVSSDFSRSENDYINGRSRISSASPTRRSANSAVMTRPSSSERTRSAYTPRSSSGTRDISTGSGSSNRSSYSTPSRSSSPSYNRSTPSRSRSTYSTPTRSRSTSTYTPSRSGSGNSSRSSNVGSSSSSRSSGGTTRSSGGSRRGGN